MSPPTSEPPSPVPSRTQEATDNPFDAEYARTVAEYIVEDLSTVDEYMLDGIAVESALYSLSDSFDRMIDAGVPPGAEPAKYLARLTTLASFAEQAADEYPDDPTEATARYSVIRDHTATLFSVLNAALGTSYALP